MSIYGPRATVSDYYRWHAPIYDWTRWAFLFGRAELIRVAAQRSEPRRILEIGCGTGANLVRLARTFPDAEIEGIDLSADMLTVARRKTAPYAGRVTLHHVAYDLQFVCRSPYDLIVLSYCLSMIHHGRQGVLAKARADLSGHGVLAVADFHHSPYAWFRDWMKLNHVCMDGQLPGALRSCGLRVETTRIRPAYGGLWQWILCLASR
ncbi:MAG: class I SAM-dependent methyltransferase [Bryobacterales bacterium]|nr:class I SAM-dependent methyltransferase [Bryobacterales bacterium]